MKRRIVASTLSSILLVGMLGGCNSNAPVVSSNESENANTQEKEIDTPISEEITIQFWNAFTGPDGEILREIVDRFNEENTDSITIEMDIMPGATLAEKLAPAIATGNAPAMILSGNMDVVNYSKTGSILPMNDFFDVTSTDKNDFVDAALESFEYNGDQMMIPMQWFTQYLYYNKDLFESAGLDPEVPPMTWEEVAEYAAKITNPDKNVYGVGFAVGGAVSWFNSLMLSNGGEILDTENKESLLYNEANIASLEFVQDIANKGYAPKGTTGADLDNLMMADQLGMVINGPWLVAGLQENEINFGVAPFPAGDSGTAAISEVTGFAIPKGTSEAEKMAVYKFIEYWNTTEICKEWSMRNGFPPYLYSVIEDEEVQGDYLVNVFSSISEYGTPFGVGIASAAVINSDVLFPMIENIILGNEVTEELEKASQKIDELLADE